MSPPQPTRLLPPPTHTHCVYAEDGGSYTPPFPPPQPTCHLLSLVYMLRMVALTLPPPPPPHTHLLSLVYMLRMVALTLPPHTHTHLLSLVYMLRMVALTLPPPPPPPVEPGVHAEDGGSYTPPPPPTHTPVEPGVHAEDGGSYTPPQPQPPTC